MKTQPQPFVAICFFLLLPFQLFAQESTRDQLVQKLSVSKPGKEKIDLLISLSENFRMTSPDTTEILSRQALLLSQEYDSYREYDALRMIGDAFNYQNRFDSAKAYYDLSLSRALAAGAKKSVLLAKSGHASLLGVYGKYQENLELNLELLDESQMLGDPQMEAVFLHNLSATYTWLGKFEISKSYAQKELTILEGQTQTETLKKRMASAYFMIGGTYGYEGDYANAAASLLKSKEIYEELNDLAGLAKALSTLGQIHNILHDDEKAIAYYRRAIAIEEKFKYPIYLQNTYRAMAELHENMGQLDSAIHYSIKAFGSPADGKYSDVAIISGSRLPLLYSKNDQPDSARYYYQKVLPLIKPISIANYSNIIWTNLGRYNFSEDNYEEAERQFLEAINVDADYSIGTKMDLSNSLYRTYVALGDYKNALKYLEDFKELSDSLFNENQIREVAELEATFEHNQELLVKENEIAVLTVKREVANLRLVVGVISFVLVTIVLIYLFRRNLRSKEQKARELEEVSRFKEAMTGMIVHDLKNPLSLVMNSSSENEKVKQAAGQMLQLVTNMLDVHKFESAKVKVSKGDLNISDLLYAVKKQVYHLLSQKNLAFNIMSDPGFSVSADHDLMERVFINLLTNAIKYSPVNGIITVQVLKCDGQFCISVSDEGTGIPAHQLDGIFNSFTQFQAEKSGGIVSTGLGLTFCKLALEAHGSEIEVSSKPGVGTTFSFRLDQATGEVLAEMEEVVNPLMQALELIRKDEVAPQISRLKKVNLYEVGEIRKILMEVKNGAQDNREAVELWVDSVLNAAYQGNDEEYDRLVEALA